MAGPDGILMSSARRIPPTFRRKRARLRLRRGDFGGPRNNPAAAWSTSFWEVTNPVHEPRDPPTGFVTEQPDCRSTARAWHTAPVSTRRPARPQPFSRTWFRLVGRFATALGLLALAGFFVWVFVAAVHDLGAPKTWGTFVEQYRESGGRGGDRVFGAWTSDDGQIVLHDVRLDGSPDPDGERRSFLRPDSMFLDADRTVHDGTGDWTSPVAAPVFFVLSLAFLVFFLWMWGLVDRFWPPRRRRPRSRFPLLDS